MGRRVSLVLISLLFLGTGILHFLDTEAFVEIVPPYIPHPLAAVYMSGAAELAGAVVLQLPPVRRLAGWGLAALLLAVFPANLYMATHAVQAGAYSLPSWMLWARLPLQFVLIYWVVWSADLFKRSAA